MVRAKLLSSVVIALSIGLQPVFAQNPCENIGLASDDLENGQVFYSKGGVWQKFEAFSSLPPGRPTTFVYVVREPSYNERGNHSGVLVIKSGILPPLTSKAVRVDSIWLVRKGQITDPECEKPAAFGDNVVVNAKAYEDYHRSESTETPELRADPQTIRTLKRFHIQYRRGTTCVGSNDFRTEFGRYTHNASQFSYEKSVVDGGGALSFRVSLFGGPAYGDTNPPAERRTEIKHYRTVSGFQCVQFTLDIAGQNDFFRVNDLETRREFPSTGRIGEYRTDK
jgi:hypothetical protein